MTDIVYDQDSPDGRDAEPGEVENFLAGMTALDGTNYLDMYRQALAEEDES